MWIASGAAAQAEVPRGACGLTVAVVIEGRFNPTVRSAKVVAVERNMPAHRAGVASGDALVEVNGQRVAGRRAVELSPLVGGRCLEQQVDLMLERADGATYRATLGAESRRR
jgi:C-terminal processing protease CtpA/Prc